jgi:hypothetical protein
MIHVEAFGAGFFGGTGPPHPSTRDPTIEQPLLMRVARNPLLQDVLGQARKGPREAIRSGAGHPPGARGDIAVLPRPERLIAARGGDDIDHAPSYELPVLADDATDSTLLICPIADPF